MEFRINMANKRVFIFTIIVFLIGILNSIYNVYGCNKIHMLSVIIGFIPIAVLVIRNTIAQGRKKIDHYSVVTPTLIGVFIGIMLLNFIIIKVLDLNYTNTDVGSYQKFLRLNNYSDNIYINHFPKEIPSGAKEIKFSEEAGFTDKFSLSYNLDHEQIKLVDGNSNIMEYKEVIKNYDQLMSTMEEVQVPNEVIGMLELKKDEENISNFKIFLIETTGIECLVHGYSYGIGINYDSNRVIYFSNKWQIPLKILP